METVDETLKNSIEPVIPPKGSEKNSAYTISICIDCGILLRIFSYTSNYREKLQLTTQKENPLFLRLSKLDDILVGSNNLTALSNYHQRV